MSLSQARVWPPAGTPGGAWGMAGAWSASPIPTSTVPNWSCCSAQPGSQDLQCLAIAHSLVLLKRLL